MNQGNNIRSSRKNCCVVDCSNTYRNTPKDVIFYSFPGHSWEKEIRDKWIRAVNRVNPDGTQWLPKIHSCICSQHFVGNKKSRHPNNLAYLPTIFPAVYNVPPPTESQRSRFERVQKRTASTQSSAENLKLARNAIPAVVGDHTHMNVNDEMPKFYDGQYVSSLQTRLTRYEAAEKVQQGQNLVRKKISTKHSVSTSTATETLFNISTPVPSTAVKRGSNRSCCVVGCFNTKKKDQSLVFYQFPDEIGDVHKARRQEWIQATRRLDYNNKPWVPTANSFVCSAHFAGGRKIDIFGSPSYIPTIFPTVYKRKSSNAVNKSATRHKRGRTRIAAQCSTTSLASTKIDLNDDDLPDETFSPQESVSPTASSTSVHADMWEPVENNDAMVTQEEGGDITTDQDLFSAAVKDEEESCQPAFASVYIKEEPVDYDETTTHDDALSGNADILLAPEEGMCNEPLTLTANPDIELGQVPSILHVRTQHDWIAVACKENEAGSAGGGELEGCFAGTGNMDGAASSAEGTHDQVTGTSTAQGQMVNSAACNECGEVFDTYARMKQHTLSHSGKEMHKCSECDYRALKSSILARHMLTHTGDKRYACSACDYRTAYRGALASHTRTHTGEKPYACSECDYRTADGRNLTKHVRAHTGVKPYACTECGYRTAKSFNLKTHMRTHTGEKLHKCKECDFRAAHSSHLTTHMRIHTGEKPYSCPECDYRTIESTCLARHMKVHTGEKMYACSECDYRTIQSGDLAIHTRTHTGEKPFACTKCDYRAIRNNSLKVHMLKHSGCKPHACTKCEYRCTERRTLKRHTLIHTDQKSFACYKLSASLGDLG